jgi:enterochelin esterase-like enzyme
MPTATKTSRAQVWMDSPGDWSWPGRAAEVVEEALPQLPSWVPALPPRLEPAAAGAAHASVGSTASEPRLGPRALLIGVLLSALLAVCVLLAVASPPSIDRLFGMHSATPAVTTTAPRVLASAPAPLPTLVADSHDAAGSSIDTADYSSAALGGATGSFHVYLPPGYSSTDARYPVLYLLHGNDQPATAFLQLGLQGELDRLIAAHEVPPMIAVMIQGGRGANNWRNQGAHRYESYVLEVQQLVDRMLATVPERASRAIAGDSMGGFGAMNVALGNPRRFSVIESWLGFFNGLDDELSAARPVIAREGLHAYVYGGASDDIADPAENAPFAAQLRAAGASAHSAVYVGGHTMETLEAHLRHMLLYVGRSLQENAQARTAVQVSAAKPAAVKVSR